MKTNQTTPVRRPPEEFFHMSQGVSCLPILPPEQAHGQSLQEGLLVDDVLTTAPGLSAPFVLAPRHLSIFEHPMSPNPPFVSAAEAGPPKIIAINKTPRAPFVLKPRRDTATRSTSPKFSTV